MVSSILGAILKTALVAAGKKPEEAVGIWAMLYHVGVQLAEAVVNFSTLGGMVIALLIFNVYEHTELGTRVKMGVGWRSALLIGVLAGLFTERLLNALTVFVGITQGP